MIKRLLKSLREFKRPAWITMLVMMGEVGMEMLIPLKMADLIDIGFANADLSYIVKTGLILISFALCSLMFGLLGSFVGARAGTGFGKNLREDMFRNVQTFSFANIDKFSTSSLITRLTTDVSNVQNTFTMAIRMAVRTPVTLLFAVTMTFVISWKLALLVLATIPVLSTALILLARKVFPIFAQIFKKVDRMNNTVQENLRGIRVVKSFVREDYERGKFNAVSNEIYSEFSRVERILVWNGPIMMFVSYTAMILVVWLGAHFIVNGEPVTFRFMGDVFTTGLLTSIIAYAMQILMSCMGLSMIFVMMTISRESMRRIYEVLEENTTITDPEHPVTHVRDGSIEFRNVSFSYAGDENRECLTDVDLRIPTGATVGIIGSTGSSKSTLVQLIPRLYDVTEGQVLVGGVDVRNYDMVALRDAVAMVLQKNVLFSGTIKENMRWGDPDASDEEIIHALKLAAADGFIEEFPDKYDTYIEQGGSNVSGGQRQRLCIARALLKKPKVLILDDSTSAVDTATDAQIQRSFREYIPDTTKLIIAQRISSVQDADMIIVMDGGRINAAGTHEELLKSNPIYREVYESQRKGDGTDGRQ